MSKNGDRGQVLVGVIVLMIVLAVLIPSMVLYVQNETRWSMKQERNLQAFQLAEAAIDRAYSLVTDSTQTWANVQLGGASIPSSFLFSATYTDISSGTYTFSISSGPDESQVTVLGVGRDQNRKELRSIKAVFTNAGLSDTAILGGEGVDITGNNFEVEWGSVVSPSSIETGGKLHPTFWSAGDIDLDSNGSAPANCDSPNCHWWRSYYAGVPPMPTVDLAAYKAIAQSLPDGPCGPYYVNGNASLDCTDTSGGTYYVTGDVTDIQGHITGNIIVLGDFSTGNGNLGGSSKTVPVPRRAWRQYSNDWAAYLAGWDSTRPATFPGKNSSYRSPAAGTAVISPVIHGFVYVDGNFQGPTGGGNIDFVSGIIYVKGVVNLNGNSHVKIYYGSEAAAQVRTTNISLMRESWQSIPEQGWPASAGP